MRNPLLKSKTKAFNFRKPGLILAFLALSLIPSLIKAQSAFGPGHLVYYRVGDGTTTPLTSAAFPINFVEMDTAGSVIQTVSVPTSTLTADGTAGSECELTLSADGTTLVFAGYTATPGTTGVNSNAAASILHGIGFVSQAGTVSVATTFANTPTSSGAYEGNNTRGGYFNGTGIWATGNDNKNTTSGSGLHYTTTTNGSSSGGGIELNPYTTGLVNTTGCGIFKDQLYFCSTKTSPPGVWTYPVIPAPTTAQTALPTQVAATVAATSIWKAILLNTGNTNSSAANGAPDVMYVSDEFRISKFYWNGTTWVSAGYEHHNVYGFAASMNSSGQIDLYCVLNEGAAGNAIYKYTDYSSRTANINTTSPVSASLDSTLLVPASSYYLYGGIEWAPSQTSAIAASAYSSTIASSGNITAGNYGDITIPSGVTATLTGNIYINGTLTVQSGGTLKCGNFFVFSPQGNFGTFNLQSGATLETKDDSGVTNYTATGSIQCFSRFYNPGANYVYDGSVAQFTGNALPSSVASLTVNNSNGLTLSAPVSVTNALTLTSGIVTLGNNKLTIASAASISGASASNYIATNGTGTLEMTAGTSGASFPVGVTDYNPLKVATSTSTSTVDVGVSNSITNSQNVALSNHAVNRTWSVTLQSTSTVTVTPQWNNSTDLAGAAFATSYSSVASRTSSTNWTLSQSAGAATVVSGTLYDRASGSIAMAGSTAYQVGVLDSTSGYNTTPFVSGNLVVERVGDGVSGTLTSAAYGVSFLEFTTSPATVTSQSAYTIATAPQFQYYIRLL